MGAIVNGMALHGGVIPYGATFLVFSDYMRPAIRMAALMKSKSIFVFTHDSVAVGEDGPTHQPIEHLASLRAMPNLVVIRPADANETAEAWKVAVANHGPCALMLSRQSLPTIDRSKYASASNLKKGAYVLSDSDKPQLLLIATGSEVYLALEAKEVLEGKGVKTRVVSMPSWELFEEQSREYRDSVIPPDIKARVAIEAGSTFGWGRWVGDSGRVIGIDRFGASAPGKIAMQTLGITSDNIVKTSLKILG
jgi:transketolase